MAVSPEVLLIDIPIQVEFACLPDRVPVSREPGTGFVADVQLDVESQNVLGIRGERDHQVCSRFRCVVVRSGAERD